MPRVGIDLGTTNTVVAMVYDDGPHVVPRGRGRTIPSVVLYGAGTSAGPGVTVGEEAANAGDAAVRSVKRLMGRTYEEAVAERSLEFFPAEGGAVRLVRRGKHDLGLALHGDDGAPRTVWPYEVGAEILAEAKRHAEAHLGPGIEALVTVPAYFRDPHRAATLDAARKAGLGVVGELLDEPTAAALAFAPRVGLRSGEPVLVVDWGGGTLDVTVLTSDGDEWLQSGIDGDLVLGGDDVDRALALHVVTRAGLGRDVLRDGANRWSLLGQARAVKELLSEREEAAFVSPRLVDPRTHARLPPLAASVTRAEFERVIAGLLDRALEVVARCLDRPNVDRAGIRKVLLVGGSSRIPAFRRRLQELMPKARLHDEVDPMQAVALGAAIHAETRPTIARISPYGYAVVDDAGTHVDVIPPDSETPTPEAVRFAVPLETRYPGQTVYRLRLAAFTEHAKGQRTYLAPRRLFARGVPATPTGTRVDVELWLDANKDVEARCHVASRPGEHRLEGREEGEGELFSRLLDATLDGEALLEANQEATKGIVDGLRTAVQWAHAVERSRHRAQAEEALSRLTDLHDQVEDHRLAVAGRQGRTPDERLRDTVAGWLHFFEQDLLVEFWDVLPAEAQAKSREKVSALRTMLATGAPAETASATLDQLRGVVLQGELEPALRAYQDGQMLGIPDRLGDDMRVHALRARDHQRAGRAKELEAELERLRLLLAECRAAFRAWRETDALVDARPDLRLHRRAREAGN